MAEKKQTGSYTPSGEEKEVLDLVLKRAREAKDFFKKTRKDKLDKFYKNFRSDGRDRLNQLKKMGGDDWMSNMFVPMTASHVRAMHPRVVDAKPELRIEGRTSQDIKRSLYAQALLDYLWEKSNMDMKIADFVWQAIIYGTTVGKVFWKTELAIRTDVTVDRDDLTEKDVEVVTEIYNDPSFEVVDLYNFFVDPMATCIDDARYVVQRYLMSKERVLSTYNNLTNEEFFNMGQGDFENYGAIREGIDGESKTDDPDIMEVLEYWEDNRLVLIINGVVGRYGINPFGLGKKPFVSVPYEKLPFEFYGIGIVEQLEQPQGTLNIIRNQRIDNVTLSIQKMFIANPYALINKKDLVARPFGIIRTSDMNAIRPVEQMHMSENAYTEDALALEAGRMATGIDDWSRGAQGPASATATAVTTQKESTLERVKLFIRNLESECYSKIMRYWIAMSYHLYDTELLERITDNGVDIENVEAIDRPVKITGKDGKEILTLVSRDDLMGMFDYKALSLSTLASTKELKIQRILDVLDKAIIAGRDPVKNEMIPNLREIWERLFEALDWDPSQMMNAQGTAPMPSPEMGGNPMAIGGNIMNAQGEPTVATPSSEESLNSIMQGMQFGMPAGGGSSRETPMPSGSIPLQQVLQHSR